MSNNGPHVWYCRDNAPTSTVGWSAITAWSTGATITAGSIRRQNATPTVGNERAFVAIVGGTTHASTEPTWVVTKGGKTTDNSVTWQECTGQPGVNGDLPNTTAWLNQKNQSTSVTIGMIIKDAALDCLFICSTPGTIGSGSEPTWNKTAGVTTADNTAVWTSIGAPANFAKWAAPFARLQNAQSGWTIAGDTVYIADDHAETQASAMTMTPNGVIAAPNLFYCMDHTASFPLATTNLKTTASITTTGNSAITFNSSIYAYGLNIFCGTGANTALLTLNSQTLQLQRWDNCSFATPQSGAASMIVGINCTKTICNSCTFSFSAAAQYLSLKGNYLFLNNCTLAGTVPTTLFFNSNPQSIMTARGCDFSSLGSGKTLVDTSGNPNPAKFLFMDCKLDAAVTYVVAPVSPGAPQSDFIRCGSTAIDYDIKSYRCEGTLLSETVVVRSGGASDGTTAISFKITTTVNSNWVNPFEALPITIWNNTTVANITITLYGIANTAALPVNDQIWFDVEYQGSSSSPIASFAAGTKANNLATGSNQAADSTSAWDSLATARVNSHTYALGDVIKLASNPNRIFFCTTAGAAAGSEPGGYATAVDGGSVTDNAAVFHAGWRFSQAVTLSSPQPQIAGYIRILVRAALASSTFYIDPKPVLS